MVADSVKVPVGALNYKDDVRSDRMEGFLQ